MPIMVMTPIITIAIDRIFFSLFVIIVPVLNSLTYDLVTLPYDLLIPCPANQVLDGRFLAVHEDADPVDLAGDPGHDTEGGIQNHD